MDRQTEDEMEPQSALILGKLKEPARLDTIEKLVGFVSRLTREHGYSDERIVEVEKAFTEVVSNIVNYAFRDVSGDIEISCTLDRVGRMVFKIIDWGKPFNMLLASDPLFKDEFVEEGMPQPSARLIKKLAETAEYQRLDNLNYFYITFSPVTKQR
ncbi:MAG TPA: ATP-binding protein [Syntrophorhabdaceae bacterium]|nr:ATP-binding protein [Syntrophorhabdaceae bacterium]